MQKRDVELSPPVFLLYPCWVSGIFKPSQFKILHCSPFLSYMYMLITNKIKFFFKNILGCREFLLYVLLCDSSREDTILLLVTMQVGQISTCDPLIRPEYQIRTPRDSGWPECHSCLDYIHCWIELNIAWMRDVRRWIGFILIAVDGVIEFLFRNTWNIIGFSIWCRLPFPRTRF